MTDWSQRDRQLGMDRAISRRDFLNGVALTIGGVAVSQLGLGTGAAQAALTESYPPALKNLRGHADGAMNVGHALRDGSFWSSAGTPEPTGESYDLVVVGGGISGLAAAHFYQKHQPGKVLIVENNDDFGGHARRNEYVTSAGRTVIGYGGSQSLQTPSYFSEAVHGLLKDVGIELEKFDSYYDKDWEDARGLGSAVFFAREVFGVDKFVPEAEAAADWVPLTPLNDKAKADLIELIDAPRDYLAGKTREEKLKQLSETTYADFLTEICGYDPQLVTYFKESTAAYFGIGIEGTTALDAWGNWNPGFGGMDLGERPYKTMSPSGRLALTDPDPYIYHFPDGNAGVARALVRKLIPAALAGSSMEELVGGKLDYTALDDAANDTRLRLNASVVKVAHDGDPASVESVTVSYVEGGKLKTVSAKQVVLACWHRVIPYLTDEISPDQVTALNDQIKVPLIYTNVLLNNWRAFKEAGISGFDAPGLFFDGASMDFPVSIGDYKFADTPDDPIVLHLSKVVVTGETGMSAREQAQAGRQLLTTISFEDMERHIRDMLSRALAGTGFDAARDIEAITCNRWSHGYALEYMRPWDAFWPDGPLPVETARQGWGRIAIANSDSGAYAYAHSAIDQAARAVDELLGGGVITGYSTFPGPPLDKLDLAG
ncbi:NAD(P)-binding protein [Devosia sp. A16]|uniref:NAD(P)-binding protein n=1 Tax=Devosia sp. A16 TaxID=1736675 RepID=UPI0006D7A42F|nr:NAD(P)-binding protein [Devosia sp. A16]